ncbi:MAG: hypothetical protein ACLRX4_11900 [Oscillospiraceae bacterium]|jgi:hypothetical protein
MARKKITPEEETPKTVALEESTAADVGDMTQNDLPPGESGTAEDCGTEAVPTTEPAEDADGMSVGGDPQKEGRGEDLAETASAEMPVSNACVRYSCRGGDTRARGRTTCGGRSWV